MQRVSSAITFLDLAFGDSTPERDKRRERWARRKGKRE
jgi:hypothetical protein